MGMTIDEAMEDIHAIQTYYNDEMQDGYVGFAKEDNESVDLAIETMRKYQKIQEILKDDTYYEEYGNNAEKFIVSAISEVLEDGKID